MKKYLFPVRLAGVFTILLTLSFSKKAYSNDRPILGVFSTGDLRESTRGWGAKWYLTDQLKWVYLFEGKTYSWVDQSRPDDSRFEVQLPRAKGITGHPDPDKIVLGDIKKLPPGCPDCRGDSTRANVAATLQGISRWFRPKPTEPYYQANYLFRAGFAAKPLNEVWLNTEKGSLYFVGNEIYLWNGKRHGMNPLIATVGLQGFHSLLAYTALNPTPLPHLLAGADGLVGGFAHKRSFLRELWIYDVYGNARIKASKIRVKEYDDFLNRSVTEVSIPPLNANLALATFVDKNGKGYFERTIGDVPSFLHLYEGKPFFLGPGMDYDSSSSRTGFNIYQWYYRFPGGKLDFFPYSRDTVLESEEVGAHKMEIHVGPRNWLAATVQVGKIRAQKKSGRLASTNIQSNPDDPIVLVWGRANYFFTSGWTTPIKELIIGKHVCKAVKTIMFGTGGPLAGQTLPWKHQSSANPDMFKCFLVGIPERFKGRIDVKLTDGTVFKTSTEADISIAVPSFINPMNAYLRTGSAPENCANSCQLIGGVRPMDDTEEEQACRKSNPHGNFTTNRKSGGYGCLWGQGVPNQNHTGFDTFSFAGPANRVVKVGRRVCFCRIESSPSMFVYLNGDYVPFHTID